jgi:type IV pilus assembly protein PilM
MDAMTLPSRLDHLDWTATEAELDAHGCALIPGLLDLVASRTKISSAVVSPFKGMTLAPSVRESQLRTDAPAYLVACGLALRRFG